MPTTHHNGIEREMTAEEVAEYEIAVSTAKAEREAEIKKREKAEKARATARKSALEKLGELGLTKAEIEALLQ